MINAGSTITVTGKKADGTDFHVAVRDPRGELDDYIGVLTVSDAAIATSGDYERFFEQDGVRYHHILDPRTGYPADSGLMQVTVICDNSMLADALSTACFVLGLEKGMALADRYQVMALFVDRDRQVWYNSSKIPDILDFSGEDQGYTLKAYE
jgi:thiamine biosynthesis lipoprotein